MRTRRHRPQRHKRTVARFLSIGLPLLGLLLLIDLVAAHFSGPIEAALTVPMKHDLTTSPVEMHVPTATPTPLPAFESLLVQDTFQRTDQGFWGTSSDGQAWMADAMSSPHFFIANGMGQATNTNGIFDAVIGPRATNSEVVFSGTLSHFSVTSNLGAVLRWTDVNNLYKTYIDGTHCILLKKVAGTVTVLKVVPFTAHDGVFYTFRFRAAGSLLFVKLWPTGQPEPALWLIMTSDSALASGYDGIRFVMQTNTTALVTSFTELGL